MGFRKSLDKIERDFRYYKTLPKVMTFPKIPFLYIWWNGKYHSEFVLHDTHYGAHSPVTRLEADLQLYYGICVRTPSAMGKLFATIVYASVRAFGWLHFKTFY